MRMQEAVSRFLADRRARACGSYSVRTYDSQLCLFRDWLSDAGIVDVAGITSDLVRAYFESLKQRDQLRRVGKLSPVSIVSYSKTLRTFFLWCQKLGYLRHDLAHSFIVHRPSRRLPKCISPSEIRQLLSVPLTVRDRAVVCLLLDSGLRIAELTMLELGDLDFDRLMVHVKRGKRDKERYSLFQVVTAGSLKAWLSDRRPAPGVDRLFVDRWGRPLTESGIFKIVRRVAVSAGVKVSPHRLRHTFATEYLDAGGKLEDLQLLMGHEHIATTMVYVHVAMARLRRDHERLSVVNRMSEVMQ